MNSLSPEFYWIVVVLTTVLSVARLSRLAVIDKFPPILYLRTRYEEKTDGTGWQWLAYCPFCVAPWFALLILGWGDLVGVYDGEQALGGDLAVKTWWAFNGWLAISYLAGSYVARDGSGKDGV